MENDIHNPHRIRIKNVTNGDLSHALAQLNVDKNGQQYQSINIQRSIYSYTCTLTFLLKGFQTTMDEILQRVEHGLC